MNQGGPKKPKQPKPSHPTLSQPFERHSHARGEGDADEVAYATRTSRTGHHEERERNERELLGQWRANASPPLPLEKLPSSEPLFDEDDQVHVSEIMIRAGQPLIFRLDEEKQSFELDGDLEKVTAPKVRTLAYAAKDLIAETVPGSSGTVEVKSLFRLDQEASTATPTVCVRFKHVRSAVSAVEALEPRLRSLMDLAGSTTDEIWQPGASKLLPNDPAAPQIVELVRQIRTAAPRSPVAPNLYMTSALFKAPVAVPERIGPPPPRDEDPTEAVEETGEVVGYLRSERRAFVLFPGRRTSTALAADMEVFFPILRQEAPTIGNKCLIRYRPGQDPREKANGKLLRVEVLWQGLFVEPPELTVAEAPEVADAQSAEPASAAPATDECVTTQSTSNS